MPLVTLKSQFQILLRLSTLNLSDLRNFIDVPSCADHDSLHVGVFSYLSYRDPNLLKTLDVYDETSNFLRELEMDNDALTKAIIGTIGDVDSYQLPDAKGYSR